MTWSLLCFLLTIAALVQAFYKIDHENFKEFKDEFKKRKRILITILSLAAITSLVSDIYTKHQDTIKDKKIEKSQEQVQFLTGKSQALADQIEAFRRENRSLHDSQTIKIVTQITSHDSNTQAILINYYHLQIDSFNNEIRRIHGEGKGRDGYVEFITEPHNVFRLSISNDSFHAVCKVFNSGDNIAYALNMDAYIVVEINNKYYSLGVMENTYPSNLSPSATRGQGIDIWGFHGYNLVTQYYCILHITYATDQELKNKQDRYIALRKLKDQGDESLAYDKSVSVKQFLKSAHKIQELFTR